MMNIHHRAAKDLDLKALIQGRRSPGRNLLVVVLPVSLVLFGGVYFLWRSLLAASAAGVGVFLASTFSNIRFFRNVEGRKSRKTNARAVEVFEISASRVLDIDFIGDDGPALCFFVGSGKALLLVGQWLMDYKSFPCESFRFHRWSDTKKPIRIEVTGPTIESERSYAQLRASHKYGRSGAARRSTRNSAGRLGPGIEQAFGLIHRIDIR
jgi:hypothetical protein